MAFTARLVLATGIVTTVVLLPLFLILTIRWEDDLLQGMALRPRERAFIWGLAYLLSVPVAFLPAWLSWRYAFSRPRILALTCPTCQWSGTCRVALRALPIPAPSRQVTISSEVEFEGFPLPEDPLKKRRERLEKRRRKLARQAEAEAEPIPDFDFGEEPPGS
jgi:hypothetical protein